MKIVNWLLILIIKGYQLMISPILSPSCRFAPSCSDYAIDGIKTNGMKAIPMIIKRILSCHPWGGSGFDPYPQSEKPKIAKKLVPKS